MKISKSYYDGYVYDLAVETNQNFFANNILVHNCGFWTAKKRYALNVYDMEGTRYIEPHLKIMGLETARSTTPAVCRKTLEETIRLVLTTDEATVIDYIENYRKKWYSYEPEQIAFPKGVNNLKKYSHHETIYIKATPIHVRGSLLYNHYVKKHGLENRYEEITDGDKIKYLYLTLPNPIKEDVIAFSKHIPNEFNVKKYTDYNKQFQKAFMDPIKHILIAIGWDYEKRSTLEGMFE